MCSCAFGDFFFLKCSVWTWQRERSVWLFPLFCFLSCIPFLPHLDVQVAPEPRPPSPFSPSTCTTLEMSLGTPRVSNRILFYHFRKKKQKKKQIFISLKEALQPSCFLCKTWTELEEMSRFRGNGLWLHRNTKNVPQFGRNSLWFQWWHHISCYFFSPKDIVLPQQFCLVTRKAPNMKIILASNVLNWFSKSFLSNKKPSNFLFFKKKRRAWRTVVFLTIWSVTLIQKGKPTLPRSRWEKTADKPSTLLSIVTSRLL